MLYILAAGYTHTSWIPLTLANVYVLWLATCNWQHKNEFSRLACFKTEWSSDWSLLGMTNLGFIQIGREGASLVSPPPCPPSPRIKPTFTLNTHTHWGIPSSYIHWLSVYGNESCLVMLTPFSIWGSPPPKKKILCDSLLDHCWPWSVKNDRSFCMSYTLFTLTCNVCVILIAGCLQATNE